MIDTELVDSARRLGGDVIQLDTELKRVDETFRDVPFEWHRFNLGDAETRSVRALEILESLHDRLDHELPGTRTQPPVRDPAPAGTAPQGRPLRFAVASIVNPVATYEEYRALFDDLGRVLGRPYEFLQRRTYQEMNDLLVRGEVDLAFICSGGYVALPSDAPVTIIAVPIVNRKIVYHSLIVVRKGSTFQRFADLEGLRFAYTDPLSNTGHLYPLFRITQLGKDPARFFASTLFSGSHDQSLLAVLHGLVDAAAINELVYNRLVAPHSPYWDELRVIDSSPDFGMPPVVAPMSVPEEARSRMREFLLHLADTPRGRERLAALGLDGFAVGRSELYQSIREMREAVGAKLR